MSEELKITQEWDKVFPKSEKIIDYVNVLVKERK